MSYKDLRSFLSCIEKEGELIRIKEVLAPEYEVSAIFERLGHKELPAIIMDKVKGYDIPIVGNLLGSKKRLALALETSEADFAGEYHRRMMGQIPPVSVKEAPVKEIVINNDIDLIKTLPVLTNHERDASPYITQGIVFTKNPETGQKSMGVHRLQVKGKNRLCVYISEFSPTIGRSFAAAERSGEPLQVAIAIGVEPALLIAAIGFSIMSIKDKLELAGSLRGEAVEVIRGETVDFDIPADSMFILEGIIPPKTREIDGPFGESSGYYITVSSPVIEITTITHQKNPIYAIFKPYSIEDSLFFDLTGSRQLAEVLRTVVPSVKDVALSMIGSKIIISIDKKNEWEARHALYASLTMFMFAKYAIVVDDDINIHNPDEVAWALTGRCQPDKDIITVHDVLGHCLDPSLKAGNIGSKLGLDATKPLDRRDDFNKIGVPADIALKADGILKKYLTII